MNPTQFIADLIRRLFARTPQFFKVIQIIGLLATVVVKLPEFLLQFGIHLSITEHPYDTIVATCGFTLAIVSQLTVSDQSKLKDSINRK